MREDRAAGTASTTGLQAIASVPLSDSQTELPLDMIQPDEGQPRRSFDEATLRELAASIIARGVLQPIRVRRDGDIYRIISGERRYRASLEAGLASIPVVIEAREDYTPLDSAIDALVENLQRDDLNVVEEIEGIYQLVRMRAHHELGEDSTVDLDYQAVEQALTRMRNSSDESFSGLEHIVERTAAELGLSWKTLAIKKASVWRWPTEVIQALREQVISLEVARVLQSIKDPEERAHWLQLAVAERLGASTLRLRRKKAERLGQPGIHERVPALRIRLEGILGHLEGMDPQQAESSPLVAEVERIEQAVSALERALALQQ